LPFYAILRAIPDKLGGVVTMAVAIFILFALPFLQKFIISSSKFDILSQFFF
jgi:quinol-cytochrome oxidoreductase complex cytochrome b subunit